MASLHILLHVLFKCLKLLLNITILTNLFAMFSGGVANSDDYANGENIT